MKKLLSAAVAACILATAAVSVSAEEMTRPQQLAALADFDKMTKSPAPKPKHSTTPTKSAWICYTPRGYCYSPYLGLCSCCFGDGSCWNGST